MGEGERTLTGCDLCFQSKMMFRVQKKNPPVTSWDSEKNIRLILGFFFNSIHVLTYCRAGYTSKNKTKQWRSLYRNSHVGWHPLQPFITLCPLAGLVKPLILYSNLFLKNQCTFAGLKFAKSLPFSAYLSTKSFEKTSWKSTSTSRLDMSCWLRRMMTGGREAGSAVLEHC